MKELEEKILEILRMHESFTDSAQWSAIEIAKLFEPYQKLVVAQDEFIEHIKGDIDYDEGCTFCTEFEIQINELRKEIEKWKQ